MYQLKWIGKAEAVPPPPGYPAEDMEVASLDEAAGLVFSGRYYSADPEVVARATALASKGQPTPEGAATD